MTIRDLFPILCALALLAPGCKNPHAARRLSILVCPKGYEHSFWKTVEAGADSAGKDLSVDVIWRGPSRETDVAGQISILEDYIQKKVDAIVLAATDEKALIRTAQMASDEKIPLITIDSGLDSDIPLSFIATDNVEGARRAARKLSELIGGKGDVALIPFVPGAATSLMREEGFKQEIAKYPGIRLVATQYSQSDVATAMSVTEDILTAHRDLAGIFAANEASAIGVVQALKAKGLAGRVKVVGFDASPDEIEALRSDALQALIVQDPFKMGYLGVKCAVDVLAGRTIQKRIDTGVYVVTKDDLEEPEIQKLLSIQ